MSQLKVSFNKNLLSLHIIILDNYITKLTPLIRQQEGIRPEKKPVLAILKDSTLKIFWTASLHLN